MRSPKAAAPSARKKVSGSWPAGSSATFMRSAPEATNAPDRLTSQPPPYAVDSSSSSARSAAFWPAASASKNVTTSSQYRRSTPSWAAVNAVPSAATVSVKPC